VNAKFPPSRHRRGQVRSSAFVVGGGGGGWGVEGGTTKLVFLWVNDQLDAQLRYIKRLLL